MHNKFNAQRTNGFASRGEYDCYLMLKSLERAGEIRNIECQVTTHLIAGISHRTDFKCWDCKRDEPLWVEYKGLEDQRWRDIKKLWRFAGPGRLRVYKGYGLRVTLVEEIIPDNSSWIRKSDILNKGDSPI